MNETIISNTTEQDGMNDAEQQRRVRRLRLLRWSMMAVGILMTYALLYMSPRTLRLSIVGPIVFFAGLGFCLVSGCWMLYRFLGAHLFTHMGSSTDGQADPTQQTATKKSDGGKRTVMLILLLIGLVTAGVGMGMSDTTPVEKQICLEEDYSGDCVEWSEGSMQVTEQNQTKPIVIAGGFIIGLIGLVGIILVE